MPNWRNNLKHSRRNPNLKLRKFSYSKKSYSNPFFKHKRNSPLNRRGNLSNKNKLVFLAVTVALLIIIWLLFFSKLFKIEKIKIEGAGENLTGEVEIMARSLAENRLIGKNNLLLYNKSQLVTDLNEKYYLENLAVKRRLPHTLEITLKEKQQAAVWREDEQYYYMDNQGKIITQVDPLNISSNSYPLIENATEVKIQEKTANIKEETINYAISLFNEFKDKKYSLEIEKFIVDKDMNTVKLAVLGGPKIFFNTKEAIEPQIAKLDLIIKNELKDNFKDKEYIDLRYANNIYIK